MNLNYNLLNIEMNESYLIQVICLELRGPGSLSIGAGSAGPMVGTSKDQQQVCLGWLHWFSSEEVCVDADSGDSVWAVEDQELGDDNVSAIFRQSLGNV